MISILLSISTNISPMLIHLLHLSTSHLLLLSPHVLLLLQQTHSTTKLILSEQSTHWWLFYLHSVSISKFWTSRIIACYPSQIFAPFFRFYIIFDKTIFLLWRSRWTWRRWAWTWTRRRYCSFLFLYWFVHPSFDRD